jgi:transcriptional regulator with XRE-family HTH domain
LAVLPSQFSSAFSGDPELEPARQPNAIDIHVGASIRTRRKILGVSQQELADALGLTFQQVQKYEKGANRVSCSKLVQIAEALHEHPSFVFEGLPRPDKVATVDAGPNELMAFFSENGGASLARMYRDLSPSMRVRLLGVAKAMVGDDGVEDRKAA